MRAAVLPLFLVAACAKTSDPQSAYRPPAEAVAQEEGAHAHEGGHHGGEHAHAGGDDATVRHRFEDVQRWTKVFDDPARDAWQKPEVLVGALDLRPGDVVADIGAGTGYFNRHLAEAVGPEGKVIAVDVEPGFVTHMTERAAAEGTPQVEARLGGYDDPKLADREVDVILLVDTYHHIDDRTDYFRRVAGALRPGGRLIVVDFRDGELPVGPPPGHKIPASKVRAELSQAAWVHAESLDVLPYQYVEVFRRAMP